MRPNPFYMLLAVLSAVFAMMVALYLMPVVETDSIRDLALVAFLFLMLDTMLSSILAFKADHRSSRKT